MTIRNDYNVTTSALTRSQEILALSMQNRSISMDEEQIFHDMMNALVDLQRAENRKEREDVMEGKLGTLLFSISRFATMEGLNGEQALAAETDRFVREEM